MTERTAATKYVVLRNEDVPKLAITISTDVGFRSRNPWIESRIADAIRAAAVEVWEPVDETLGNAFLRLLRQVERMEGEADRTALAIALHKQVRAELTAKVKALEREATMPESERAEWRSIARRNADRLTGWCTGSPTRHQHGESYEVLCAAGDVSRALKLCELAYTEIEALTAAKEQAERERDFLRRGRVLDASSSTGRRRRGGAAQGQRAGHRHVELSRAPAGSDRT